MSGSNIQSTGNYPPDFVEEASALLRKWLKLPQADIRIAEVSYCDCLRVTLPQRWNKDTGYGNANIGSNEIVSALQKLGIHASHGTVTVTIDRNNYNLPTLDIRVKDLQRKFEALKAAYPELHSNVASLSNFRTRHGSAKSQVSKLKAYEEGNVGIDGNAVDGAAILSRTPITLTEHQQTIFQAKYDTPRALLQNIVGSSGRLKGNLVYRDHQWEPQDLRGTTGRLCVVVDTSNLIPSSLQYDGKSISLSDFLNALTGSGVSHHIEKYKQEITSTQVVHHNQLVIDIHSLTEKLPRLTAALHAVVHHVPSSVLATRGEEPAAISSPSPFPIFRPGAPSVNIAAASATSAGATATIIPLFPKR